MQLVDVLAFLGFVETLILLAYATRCYIFTWVARRSGRSDDPDPSADDPPSNPFVTVLLPVYNEPNVIDRLLTCCTSFDFPDYEVIVIDDSADETQQKLEKWKGRPRVKLIHRNSRRGWKGGALNDGLDNIDPRSTHILVLDADFVPPSNMLQRFLSRFTNEKIAAVQGYQRHDLNADENWVTKGIRVTFSANNMVEFNAKNALNLIILLTGSVYMVRADVLRKLRFEEDITEDWNLTLRLYEAGYKVVYDPTLIASGECSRTLTRYFRQNIRWAEGHTRNFKRHFWRMLRCDYLSLREKVEFVLFGGVYLNSVMVLASMIGGILSLPSWSYALSVTYAVASILFVIAGIPAPIFASWVALRLEKAEGESRRIPYSLFLAYITTPVIAYASLKGLLTTNGFFHRTFKTGRVTRSALSWSRTRGKTLTPK